MTTLFKEVNSTARSASGQWTLVPDAKPRVYSSDTKGSVTGASVLHQGRVERGADGRMGVVVNVNPSAVDRKLAIRQANDRLQGRDAKSGTFVDIKR